MQRKMTDKKGPLSQNLSAYDVSHFDENVEENMICEEIGS